MQISPASQPSDTPSSVIVHCTGTGSGSPTSSHTPAQQFPDSGSQPGSQSSKMQKAPASHPTATPSSVTVHSPR